MFKNPLKTGKNQFFETFIIQDREIGREQELGEHGVKTKTKKKDVERIFEILLLSGDNKPRKLSCLPSGKIS